MFEPVINQVIDLIEEQVQQSKTKLDAIFLVGGFGQSTYLYRRVLAEFQSRVGFIGVPPRGELAVVRGAVYFGLNPRMVTERVSRRTYGLETRMVFDPRYDPPEQCIKGDDNRLFCKQRFSVYVQKGQAINADYCVSKNFMIAYPNDTDTGNLIYKLDMHLINIPLIDLFAYDGDGPIPRLTTHPQVFKVARFPIKMPKFPDVQKGQPIFMTIKMYFGQTEIKIEAQIRDRKFTFTSAFETMEREMMHSLSAQTNLLTIKPDDSSASFYQGTSQSNTSGSNLSTTRPPSSRDLGYPSPNSKKENDDNTFYDGDSRHSSTFNDRSSARKIFGIKFGKKR